jgi:hypothetical protein
MSVLPVLGVDPGGRNTGLVVRHREELLAWALEVRPTTGRMPDGPYLTQVRLACTRLLEQAGLDPRDRRTYIVGVETVAYWPEKRAAGKAPRDQRGLYGTAMVLGGILTRWPDATVVDSGRGVANYHPQAYPPAIRPPVNGAGLDRLKDVRAAWDHSLAAETLWLRTVREVRP